MILQENELVEGGDSSPPSVSLRVARRLSLKEQKESCNILLRNLGFSHQWPEFPKRPSQGWGLVLGRRTKEEAGLSSLVPRLRRGLSGHGKATGWRADGIPQSSSGEWVYTQVSVFHKSDHRIHPVTQSCLTLCNPMDCSMPGLPVHHQLLELTQPHVHWVGDAIQPSHPLSSPSPPTFNLSQHQGPFQWASSLHQVAKE